jgi:hypothetical protein
MSVNHKTTEQCELLDFLLDSDNDNEALCKKCIELATKIDLFKNEGVIGGYVDKVIYDNLVTEYNKLKNNNSIRKPSSSDGTIKEKADMWDAVMSSGRIRILGSSSIGDAGYQHFGMEIWSIFRDAEGVREQTDSARRLIEEYAKGIMKAPLPSTLKQDETSKQGDPPQSALDDTDH